MIIKLSLIWKCHVEHSFEDMLPADNAKKTVMFAGLLMRLFSSQIKADIFNNSFLDKHEIQVQV